MESTLEHSKHISIAIRLMFLVILVLIVKDIFHKKKTHAISNKTDIKSKSFFSPVLEESDVFNSSLYNLWKTYEKNRTHWPEVEIHAAEPKWKEVLQGLVEGYKTVYDYFKQYAVHCTLKSHKIIVFYCFKK